MELTAEEWKRRFEKEREISQKLKRIIQHHEAELAKWRVGEKVPEAERSRLNLKTVQLAISAADESPASLQGALPATLQPTTPISQMTTYTGTPSATPTPVQTRAFEEERSRLCQQLDEKVNWSR